MNRRQFLTSATSAGLASLAGCGGSTFDLELLNVSYDPTRELYRKINRLFSQHYLETKQKKVRVRQSHGGSGSQARAVIDGIPADVVTLAMWNDVDAIRAKNLIDDEWESQFANRSLPYVSTIVFVVRKGNPFGIQDWPDLLQSGLRIITANPKTGGGAKLNLLGAWLAILDRGGSARDAREFVTHLYRRVPVLDTGARGATMTFARKNIGDVHLTWENEAELEKRELRGELEIIYPPVSIRAEPHVAVVNANARRKGTAAAARDYLEFLYQPQAQELIAELFFRPLNWERDPRFPRIRLMQATDPKYGLGDWNQILKDFFSEGGLFDRIYRAGS